MARAIFHGGVDGNVLTPSRVIVAEPDETRRNYFKDRGARVFATASEAVRELVARDVDEPGGFMLMAVKPQTLRIVADEVRPILVHDRSPRLVVSILAGTPTPRVAAELGHHVRVVRAMPNMPAEVREGTTALCAGPGATDADLSEMAEIFRAVGQMTTVIDEQLMDAFTAVAGSGPAYVFFLANAMTDAAVKLGFERSVADQMVRTTISGSGYLLAQSIATPEQLLAGVQSKGGTTEAAMNVLADQRVHKAFIAALTAARDRGHELSGG
jgi:pyrroline-5-carboxylate reductase